MCNLRTCKTKIIGMFVTYIRKQTFRFFEQLKPTLDEPREELLSCKISLDFYDHSARQAGILQIFILICDTKNICVAAYFYIF